MDDVIFKLLLLQSLLKGSSMSLQHLKSQETFIASILAMNSSFGSSAPAMNIAQYVNYFGVSKGLALSTISLYIAGWVQHQKSMGEELYLLFPYLYTLACLGCGFSEKIYQILILRFVAGCSGAASICISGAVIGDVFEADMRGIGVSIISLAPFAGVALSPVIGVRIFYISVKKMSNY
ncbi:hypothetical protein BY996DRAFT_6428509 [Phakopsora pachyrhizi]|nr:hypothetical protein BY996DRAFT_6428509 [Phakopsora pachyrhizi]